MEPIENSKQSICLNMIVKDESHIVIKTLENILSKIEISYWVICDTGSNDDTKDLIKNFFLSRNIPGELYEDIWQDFGHNRTLAVSRAFEKADYILFFDADDEIVGNIEIPFDLDKESYGLIFGPSPIYRRPLLVRGDIKWKWTGVLHEFVSREDGGPTGESYISGDYHIISGKLGNRSKTPELYLRDAEVLERAYNTEDNVALKSRYAYYCGQSRRDALDYAGAAKWYKICSGVSQWAEESFHSAYMTGWCLMRVSGEKNIEEIAAQMFAAWMKRPSRVESLFELGIFYKERKMWEQAYTVLKICSAVDLPSDKLFVNKFCYAGGSSDEFAVAAYWHGKYDESSQACKRLIKSINNGQYPLENLTRIKTNLWWSEKSAGRSTNTLDEYLEQTEFL